MRPDGHSLHVKRTRSTDKKYELVPNEKFIRANFRSDSTDVAKFCLPSSVAELTKNRNPYLSSKTTSTI